MTEFGLLLLCALIAAPVAAWVTAHGQSQISHDPSLGMIEGVVVDANNKPIKGASVYADNLGLPTHGRLQTVQTDDQGHLVLDDVYPGDIAMRAFKEADMYGRVDSKYNMPDG